MNTLKFLKLDIKIIRSQFKVFFIYPTMGLILIFFIMNDITFIIGYMMLGFTAMATAPFSMEYTNSRNVFYFTLPAGVKSMVLGRYLVLVLMAVLYWGMSFLLAIASILKGGIITDAHVFYFSVFWTAGIIISLIQYAVFFKLGVPKSQQFFSLIQMLPGMALWLVMSFGGRYIEQNSGRIQAVFEYGISHLPFILLSEVLLLVLVFIVTYYISCVIYSNKEL